MSDTESYFIVLTVEKVVHDGWERVRGVKRVFEAGGKKQ